MKLDMLRSRFDSQVFLKLLSGFAILDLCWLMAGCGNWESQASSILTMIGPAIQAAIAILAAFGVGVSPDVMTAFGKWSTEAQAALAQLKTLIDQYSAALATAKPGILAQIESVLATTTGNLSSLLTTLHVTDPATQQKIAAVFAAIAGMLAAVGALIPVLQGKVEDPKEEARLYVAYKTTTKAFKATFDSAVDALGPDATKVREQYGI
jgi:hypothetical protein